MGNMLEAMTKVGLVTADKASKEEARREQDRSKKNNKARFSFTLADVLASDTMLHFTATIKDVLLKDPSTLKVIIQEAHRFMHDPDGKRMIAILYRLREDLQGVDDLAKQRKIVKTSMQF